MDFIWSIRFDLYVQRSDFLEAKNWEPSLEKTREQKIEKQN